MPSVSASPRRGLDLGTSGLRAPESFCALHGCTEGRRRTRADHLNRERERQRSTLKHFPRFALTVDLANAFEWLNALERRVAQLEELTGTLTAVRSDLASIAEGTDPALAQRLADLGSTVENHGLLLAQLLDQRT
jgi:hypothetical protein